jgi:guanylate kinase
MERGLIVVISGPSGVGKNTILNGVMEMDKTIIHSISVTTRKQRPGDIDGKTYFFKTQLEFKEMINRNQLVEWDEFCGEYYGTPIAPVLEAANAGNDMVLDLTVKGAIALKEFYQKAVTVFLMPPSFDELARRIESRRTDSPEAIKKRLKKAEDEFDMASKFQYCIINDNLTEAINDFLAIMRAEKLRNRS